MIGIDALEGLFGGWKLWATLLLVAAVVAGIFSAGWAVNGWRLDAKHREALAAKDSVIADLSTKITTQNHAVDILAERKAEADERRSMAEKYNAQLVNANNKLQAVIANSKATDCDGMLREAWGAWK